MKIVEGIFSRKSPAQFAETIGIPMGWFVISFHCIPEKSVRRYAHGRWYKISSNTRSIYRILRFSGNLKAHKGHAGEIVIDWVGWLDLNDRIDVLPQELNISIRPVAWWKIPFMAAQHPDPSYRLAGTLALVSVTLGILAVILAIAL